MLKEKLDPFPWLMKIMNILIFRLLVFQPKSEKEARWRGKETRCFREENLYQHQHFFLINTNVSIIYWYLLQYQSSRQFPQHTFWLQLYIFSAGPTQTAHSVYLSMMQLLEYPDQVQLPNFVNICCRVIIVKYIENPPWRRILAGIAAHGVKLTQEQVFW